MKNILLTTTALATLFAGVAAAGGMSDEGLSVTLGGEFEAQAGFRSQSGKYLNATQKGLAVLANPNNPSAVTNTTVFKQGLTPGNQNVAFDTVTAVHASVKNKTASGLVYGAQIGIQTTTRSQLPAGENTLDRTYLFMQNDMGRVEVGSNNAVTSTMRTGADSIARATGGIDGQWQNYVNLNTFQSPNYTAVAVNSNNFILAPTTFLTNYQASGAPSSTFMEGDEKARKITYYTPEYNGFQAGLSYTPDTRNSGQDYLNQLGQNSSGLNVGQYNLPTARNAVSAGVSWTGNFEKNQSLKVSAVGETANVKENAIDQAANNTFKGVRSGVVGAQYTYESFSVAGSYGNQGKSMYSNALASSMKAGSFYTLGAAYVQGPVGASLTYMNSTQNKNTLQLVSLGVDYQLAPGLLPYAEVTYFTMKQKNAYVAPNAAATGGAIAGTNTATNFKNNGTAFILGTRINF